MKPSFSEAAFRKREEVNAIWGQILPFCPALPHPVESLREGT